MGSECLMRVKTFSLAAAHALSSQSHAIASGLQGCRLRKRQS